MPWTGLLAWLSGKNLWPVMTWPFGLDFWTDLVFWQHLLTSSSGCRGLLSWPSDLACLGLAFWSGLFWLHTVTCPGLLAWPHLDFGLNFWPVLDWPCLRSWTSGLAFWPGLA